MGLLAIAATQAAFAQNASGDVATWRRGGSASPEQPDGCVIRAASDQLVDIIDGRRSMFSSVMTGRVKVEAGLADLLRLRRLG